MKKFNVFLLSIFLIPTLYFSSCAKEDDDDFEVPSILYARMNMHDTLYTKDAIKITLNDSTIVGYEIDTVVIGKWLFIDAAFLDKGRGLSSFKVETELRYKYGGNNSENLEMYKDSILKIMRRGNNIYGRDTAFIYGNRLVKIADSISRNYNGTSVPLKLVEGDYDTKIVCMDIAGNKDSIEFPVRYLSRSSVIKARQK